MPKRYFRYLPIGPTDSESDDESKESATSTDSESELSNTDTCSPTLLSMYFRAWAHDEKIPDPPWTTSEDEAWENPDSWGNLDFKSKRRPGLRHDRMGWRCDNTPASDAQVLKLIEGWVKHLGEPPNLPESVNVGDGDFFDYSIELLEERIEQGPICTDTGKTQDIVKMKLWLKKLEGKKERLETLGLYHGDEFSSTDERLRMTMNRAVAAVYAFDSDLDMGIRLLRDRSSQALHYIDSGVVGEHVTVMKMARKAFELSLKLLLDEKERRETIPDEKERKAHYKEFYAQFDDRWKKSRSTGFMRRVDGADRVWRRCEIEFDWKAYEHFRNELTPRWVEFPGDDDELDDGICLLRGRIHQDPGFGFDVHRSGFERRTRLGESEYIRGLRHEGYPKTFVHCLNRKIQPMPRGPDMVLSGEDIVRMDLWLKKLLDERERRETLKPPSSQTLKRRRRNQKMGPGEYLKYLKREFSPDLEISYEYEGTIRLGNPLKP